MSHCTVVGELEEEEEEDDDDDDDDDEEDEADDEDEDDDEEEEVISCAAGPISMSANVKVWPALAPNPRSRRRYDCSTIRSTFPRRVRR